MNHNIFWLVCVIMSVLAVLINIIAFILEKVYKKKMMDKADKLK